MYKPQTNNIKTIPTIIESTNYVTITLEEALESGKPVYTRARGVPELFEKGILPISKAVENGDAIDKGGYLYFKTNCYIYNYLGKRITPTNPNISIPL